jgi:hypothetical protein
MSDATSPPPRSSSAPADETAHENGSELSFLEGEYDMGLDQSYMSTAKEEASGDSEGRADNKQKRKRTRYVRTSNTCISLGHFCLWSSEKSQSHFLFVFEKHR